MSKTRRCKIIPAEVTDVIDGSYILSLPDGDQYKVEGGEVPMKKGSLIRFDKDSFFKLTNDVVLEDFEEITVLKEEPNDTDTADVDFSICSSGKEKNFAVWQDAPTRLLIDLYKELRPAVDGHKFKKMRNMWDTLADRLQEEGYSFDSQQVESKWKSLVRSYRTGLAHGMRRKTNYLAASFEKEIGEILTSQGISFEVVNEDDSQETEDENHQYTYKVPATKKRKSANNPEDNSATDTSTSASDMTLLIKAINRRTSQKERSDQIKQEQRERLIGAIQERNELLKKIYLLKENR